MLFCKRFWFPCVVFCPSTNLLYALSFGLLYEKTSFPVLLLIYQPSGKMVEL